MTGAAMPLTLDKFKITEKDENGRVVQVHEVYRGDVPRYVMAVLERSNIATVRALDKVNT